MTNSERIVYGRPLVAAVLLLAGIRYAPTAWWIGLLFLGVPLVVRTMLGMLRGRFAADVVAALSVATAIALGQPLAGLVIVLMQTGGEALDRYAEGRASAAVRALEADAPRFAHRRRAGVLEDVPVDAIRPADLLLVRPGEMIPCDATVVSGEAAVDASRLTGEPLPIQAGAGAALPSGALVLDAPLELRATHLAADSQYAQIVRLVRSAQASKAPLQREADRWAVWFTPVTLLVCVLAWFLSGDPLRVLAVLVVATPCPLILAAPVALIGGIDRGARLGVIFRNGTALEQLGRATVAILDKTGTLTIGRPVLERIEPVDGRGEAELLTLVAAIEQGAGHQLARSVVAAAMDRDLTLPTATGIVERAGQGVTGSVDGRTVSIGSLPYLAARSAGAVDGFGGAKARSGLVAYVAVDDRAAGVLHFGDRIRAEAPATLAALRDLGFHRLLLLSGDHLGHAEEVARALGLSEVQGDLLPADKLRVVRALQGAGERVMMLGDGTNDAPALSAADIGVALAGHGGGVSAEAAGLVLLQDDLARLPLAIRLSRRTLRVARQSISAGLGLSGIGMVFAALGMLAPVAGAVTQEVIDVAVILWSLRAAAPLAARRA